MLLDKKKGRTYASVSYLPNAGHMVCTSIARACSNLNLTFKMLIKLMQVKPDEVAIKLSRLLEEITAAEIHAHL
jgi:16S rRNA G527 N7-methylase RsmG